MHSAPPPLNALRAFEAAARHLSLTKAALELNVTPGALSHQVRGLEDHLGVKLFDRGVRSIALTAAGKALYPGLQAAFVHIRDALASLNRLADARVLVVSTPPGFTSKWLAPRLYRFSIAYPEIDVRVSSSMNNANFATDGVDAAIRNLPVDAAHDEAPEVEKLIDQSLVPVCSPALVEKHGPFTSPDMLKGVPLIHDDSLSSRAVMPNWAGWFAAAGVRDADVSRGLRFNSADHALDATVEGAGVLLALDALAYDGLRTGHFGHALRPDPRFGPLLFIRLPEEAARLCERAGLPRVAQGRSGRPRPEQVRDARSQFAARGGIIRDALN
jgi:LysR family transcriptional regulator, glycine cleavage system transcriptional activator